MARLMPERRIAEEVPRARSLDELYREHSPQLARHCMRLTGGNRDSADDLMQEVFTRFITRFPEPPADMNVGGYLHAMAKNLLWKQLRDRHDVPDDRIEESMGADEDIEVDPERAALLGEQRSQVQRCAALLTGHQQRALTLREVEGRSYAEIGGTLGLGADAVAQVIARGRARLRIVLRRAQIDPEQLAPECRALIAPLSAYLDNHGSGSKEITDHLAECESCRATVTAMQEAGFRLRGLAPFAPIAAALARVGEVVRVGLDGPVGITAGSLAIAGALAVTGGGALVARQLSASQPAQAIAVIGPRHVAAMPPAPVATTGTAPASPATVVVRHGQTPALTPVYRPSYLTPSVATPARLTPVYHAPAHAPAATTETTATTPAASTTPAAPVTTSQVATPQRAPAVTPTTPEATTPEATTPAVTPTTPSVPATTPSTPANDTGTAARAALTPVVGAVKTVVGKVLGGAAPSTAANIPSVIPEATTPAVKAPATTAPSTTTGVPSQIPNASSATTPAVSTPPISIQIKIG